MEIRAAKRLDSVQASATLKMAARAAELKAQGAHILNLSVGEPDFTTPTAVKHAGIQAIEDNFTRYTPVEGIRELRQAVVYKFAKDNQLIYQLDEILISNGGKQSFFNLVQAWLNPGDEVLIPAPFWVSYLDMVLLAGGRPRIIKTEMSQRFKLTPELLRAQLSPNTRLLVLNSPSNPSGMAYERAELEALGQVISDFPNLLIASDDMYEHILWREAPFVNLAMCCPELKPRIIILHGVSKTYAMTGWRIGFAAGPKTLIAHMNTIQSQSTSNPCSISQKAAISALTMDQSFLVTQLQTYQARHDYLVQGLNKIKGLRCLSGDGTFYAFVEVSQAMQALEVDTDLAFAELLLDKIGLAVVPGSAFGLAGFVRLSFACEQGVLVQALERLNDLLGQTGSKT